MRTGPGQCARRPRFDYQHVYYLLAAFDLVTIALTLCLTHAIDTSFRDSIHVNAEWANRLERFADLRFLATKANSPGNNVFDSGDVATERAALRAASASFVTALSDARADTVEHVEDPVKTRLIGLLARLEWRFGEMCRRADALFVEYAQGHETTATMHMNAMDKELYAAIAVVDDAARAIHEVQVANFAGQAAHASALRRFEWMLAVVIVGMVCGASFYGRRLSKRIRRSQEESAEQLRLLAERERELALAGDRAEAANEAKSQFLANMSHEIRTPLTSILGFAELVADGVDDEEQRANSQTIIRNSEHLLELINDILDLSKIEAGKLSVRPVPVSVVDVVAGVLELMHVRARGKGLAIAAEFPDPIPARITTDPTRLRQILVNLVGNSIKFTEAGTVRVVVRTDPERPRQLIVSVIDQGIGMSEEHLALLFRPFQQADESTTRRFGGTGLGLTISKRFAEMLGGDLVPRSSLGVGSEFQLTIDTGDLDGAEMTGVSGFSSDSVPSANDDARPVGNDGAPLRGMRILLAEDGLDNQRLISHHLRRAGATVEVVGNGQLALEATSRVERAFDLILMDMQMPVLGGLAAVRQLRERGDRTPVIAITANAMREDQDRCLSAGCDDYETKPIRQSRLLEKIRRLVGAPVASVE